MASVYVLTVLLLFFVAVGMAALLAIKAPSPLKELVNHIRKGGGNSN